MRPRPQEHTRWGRDHPREGWFDVRELEPGVHLIGEPGHVNSFLIQGASSAVLLDTGLGVADIRSVAEELTDRRLLVVNSHYHFDHTGGNGLFEDVAIHRAGADLLQRPPPDGLAAGYMEYTRRLLEAWGPYKAADDLYFHLLTVERLVRPLPRGFDPATYRIVPTVASRLLDDGDVLDLGGRRLRILHTPGHSPDCICVLDEENGLLFGGDTINTGPIYAHLPESDLAGFAQSTRRLAQLEAGVRRVFVCHFLRVENEPRLLGEIAEGFERLLAGDVDMRDNVDCLDFPVREACFDHFSIFVPAV
ncbi:MAG TPA: MBL fold metallo-hydrolase [Candidatus Dormibacteraeota bacterium]|nr:MBL fold metallo-hydrolase [Candidatus Dormibacteraeota bacterium]